jgi:two-component system response regulator VicR
MGSKVLIIEDDPDLLTLMGDAFRKSGADVFLARDGQVGMEMFETSEPDLVITDIVMPAKEGVSVIVDIRKSLSDVPVIAISGGGSRACKSYLLWAKEFGADMIVPKPFRMSILLLMAKQLMRERLQKTHSGREVDDFKATDPLDHVFAS